MDQRFVRRGEITIMPLKKGHIVGRKDATTDRAQNAHYCNRIGCSGRIKYTTHNMKNGSSTKGNSSNGNEMTKTPSSRSITMRSRTSSSLDSKRKLPSQLEFNPSESSQSGDSEQTSSPIKTPTKHRLGLTNKSREITTAETGNPDSPSNVRSGKALQQKLALKNKNNTQPASSVTSISKRSGLGTLNSYSNIQSRYRLKNPKSNSISDGTSPSCSSSSSLNSVGKNVMNKKKKPLSYSSLSHRERQNAMSASLNGLSIPSSRQANNGGPSGRTQRSKNTSSCRMRPSNRQNGSIPQITDHERTIGVGGPTSPDQFSAIGSLSGSSSYSLSSSSNYDDRPFMERFRSSELDLTCLMNDDALDIYYMAEDAQDLSASELEMIQRYLQIPSEEIVSALRSSELLGALNLYDQHRDMRLDIDNMSYEELLALEERMGTVSTALSDETLLKCIRISTYQATSSDVRFKESGEGGDDTKCTICQEEYVGGDEIGKLVECQHGYHTTCINQWLRLKNWCPICKAAAAPPQSSSWENFSL